MLVKHTKEVLVEILPKMIRYSIPLYLPQERLHFKAPEIIIEIPFTPNHMIDLDALSSVAKNAPRKITGLSECPASSEKLLQMN